MAELPTAEDNGRLILKIFARFNRRPGEALRANNFIAVAAREHIRTSDLQSGLDFAAHKGWVTVRSDGFYELTSHGFQAT